MRLYADTSWWLAYKCRLDALHEQAVMLFDLHPEVEVLWTPWQRVEVFNSFRQAERHGLVARGEAQLLVNSLQQEVKLGYWPHAEFDWTSAVRAAGEISAKHSVSMVVRGMDLFHIAIAHEVSAEAFLSFDEDQVALAKASGLKLLKLGKKKR
jgi:predicted nucleic acid-binding protein